MEKQWYVVHTYTGSENKVKQQLADRIAQKGMENFFGEILVPEENIVELVKGQKRTSKRRFYSGYILVQMHMSEKAWDLVRQIPKVTGFVGEGHIPTPVQEEEIGRIKRQVEEGAGRPKPKVVFEKGEIVRVIDGPFTNFTGAVQETKPDRGKVKVLVSIFGRATPIELDFIQVSKV